MSRSGIDGVAASPPGPDDEAASAEAAGGVQASAPAFTLVPFVVEANYAGWRLDRYLCEKIRRLSRAHAQRLIRGSLVSDAPLKPSSTVRAGMTFHLRRPVREEPSAPDSYGEIFADPHLLVVDKPAGLPMHPSARYHLNTLTALLEQRSPGAHPAHRLDRETSGLVVCGRSAEASRRLMRAFVEGRVQKEYVALCEGWPEEEHFEVDAAIAEGTEQIRVAVRIDDDAGKPARTRFEVLERLERDGERFAKVRALPRTGRQHQIRIHLAHAGFPLVGDKMYGPDPLYFDRFSKGCLEEEAWERLRMPRHALHAARLTLDHPISGERLTFAAPLPPDLVEFWSGSLIS